jgi:hypothetical protein
LLSAFHHPGSKASVSSFHKQVASENPEPRQSRNATVHSRARASRNLN